MNADQHGFPLTPERILNETGFSKGTCYVESEGPRSRENNACGRPGFVVTYSISPQGKILACVATSVDLQVLARIMTGGGCHYQEENNTINFPLTSRHTDKGESAACKKNDASK